MSYTRKLASVVEIRAVAPVPNADRLELVTTLGYPVVAEKGRWTVGEKAVYFEADSVLPDIDALRWVWTPKDTPPDVKVPRPENQRVRPIRLRGCVSNGIIMKLPELGLADADFKEGDDVTALLGVTQYEDDSTDEAYRAPFPASVPKTSEARVQSLLSLLDEMKGLAWVATLKIDGQSLTAFRDHEGAFHVAGRKHSILESDVPHWQVARKHRLGNVLDRNPHVAAIQGEVAGEGIIGNHLNLKGHHLFVYNVMERLPDGGTRPMLDEAMRDFCTANGLTPVPKVTEGVDFNETIESLLKLAEGKYPNSKHHREGIVIRPSEQHVFSNSLGKWLSFKVLNPHAQM